MDRVAQRVARIAQHPRSALDRVGRRRALASDGAHRRLAVERDPIARSGNGVASER